MSKNLFLPFYRVLSICFTFSIFLTFSPFFLSFEIIFPCMPNFPLYSFWSWWVHSRVALLKCSLRMSDLGIMWAEGTFWPDFSPSAGISFAPPTRKGPAKPIESQRSSLLVSPDSWLLVCFWGFPSFLVSLAVCIKGFVKQGQAGRFKNALKVEVTLKP